jgi:hypothetical protein
MGTGDLQKRCFISYVNYSLLNTVYNPDEGDNFLPIAGVKSQNTVNQMF